MKIAFALDEAKFYEPTKISIELRADRLNSFSRIGNYPVTLGLSIAAVIFFMVMMYKMIPALRTSVFFMVHSLLGRQSAS
jgi:hypothetical protein